MFCQEFSRSNILFIRQPTATESSRRRALSSLRTIISFVMTHPTGSPLNGPIALVPPFTAVDIVTQSIPMLQNITGVTVIGVEALITNPSVILVFIAQIILPIFITLIVLALVIGVVIIIVIV